ncbi:NADH-quinone oxidoreductase subunit N [Sinimarinibacterium sp. NLF-5-8]|uniref:NADH-quinone oxidoreductase subunit N n=1 Tax=Sinimarinibacterium sp. NLF-5-8 TaxID=2698684 RepID=UPI00137BD5BD|nr:NADH-quinone oxidoreductase subunit N [Sinimarinibacterium sp. NLF-5-8]QHS10223.1 NADH-quinone oxidoreductase subunit N [Sinimarinibacterium sp. NLF-5-8]
MTPALTQQLIAAAPLLLMALGTVVLMGLIATHRNHRIAAQLTTLGFLLTIGACLIPQVSVQVTPLLMMDDYARFGIVLIAAAGLVTVLFLYGYLLEFEGWREEMYLLLLLTSMGAMVLVAARHAASLVLGLEIMTSALFGMIAYARKQKKPLEAGIKYLILSAAATATLLFGLALIYAASGSLTFDTLATGIGAHAEGDRLLASVGMAMVWIGFAFKLSVVPLHLWAADVYDGAPAPVTGFLASISKGAMAMLMLRWLGYGSLQSLPGLTQVLGWLAVASILVGNIAAIQQNNVKRMLAYSSIAHFGYLMVPIVLWGSDAREAVLLYVVAYTIMTIGSFGAVAILSGTQAKGDADRLYDYRGLFWRRPLVTSTLTPMLLAQAGVPLTVGFIAKFYVLMVAVDQSAWGLALAVVIGSAIGLYYYLRLVIVQFLPRPGGMYREGRWSEMSVAAGVGLVITLVLLIGAGVWPQPLIDAVRWALIPLG